jgi:hypothetical protein
MKDVLEIRDSMAAQVLSDVEMIRHLEPFFKDEITLSDAAKKLDLKMTTLLYHVSKWVQMGILEVTREEARKGKAIKYYRTSATAFYIPFEVTPSYSLQHLLTKMTYDVDTLFNREAAKVLQEATASWGIYLTCDKQGEIVMSLRQGDKEPKELEDYSFDPNKPALITSVGVLEFDFETAKAFEKDLREVFLRYSKKQAKDGQPYAYRIGLTPVSDQTFEAKD